MLVQWNLSTPTHQGIREMCWNTQVLFQLTEILQDHKFCRISQDVGKLRYRIAQVPLYSSIFKNFRLPKFNIMSQFSNYSSYYYSQSKYAMNLLHISDFILKLYVFMAILSELSTLKHARTMERTTNWSIIMGKMLNFP